MDYVPKAYNITRDEGGHLSHLRLGEKLQASTLLWQHSRPKALDGVTVPKHRLLISFLPFKNVSQIVCREDGIPTDVRSQWSIVVRW